MGTDAKIRRVSVEFLRPGPSHNQLLSPYTQYLAVCNDAGAGVVTVPYEHHVFERRLKELRYETGDQTDRLDMLHEIGAVMGGILESVPGLTGELMPDRQGATLVHLRMTLSAAELALLPFELAQVPVGSSGSALSIQTRPPVAVTRHIRTVPSEGIIWPQRPRILFVVGDKDVVPYSEHRNALLGAIKPFQYPNRDEGPSSEDDAIQRFGDLLTIMVDPNLTELQTECQTSAYTHIHVLTHGDRDDMAKGAYGLVLRGESGAPDVVLGERFVSAITRVGHHPSVVTIASCDSGNAGPIVIPAASFAHAVHKAGIPLVVGAQFPLSKEGSIPLTRRLYEGLLWGEHPLCVLQEARAELHARYNTNWHDWASVVVYESLPLLLDDQLDTLRYHQAMRASNAALEGIDIGVAAKEVTLESLESLKEAAALAVDRLPLQGHYGVECLGLRASSQKRLAQAAFSLAGRVDATVSGHWDPYQLLEQSKLEYRRAVDGLLVNDSRAIQRKATLHWVLVQLVSLTHVLEETLDPGEWEAGRLSAERYENHADTQERAWAYGSLAELWLLKLGMPNLSEEERLKSRTKAEEYTQKLSDFYPGIDEFPVKSTRRQFDRYLSWWGDPRFATGLQRTGDQRPLTWTAAGGLLETAKRMVAILRRRTVSLPTRKQPAGREPQNGGGTGKGGGTEKGGSTKRARASSSSSGATAGARVGSSRKAQFFNIEALPAGHGDCLWIEYGDKTTTHRWLIDCGTQSTSKALLKRVDAVPANERLLELFILSHIDSDHIGGALPFFKAVQQGLRFNDVWFNGWRHVSGQLGARQGEMFSTAILDFELPWNLWRHGRTIAVDRGPLPEHILPGGMKLTLLSPTPAELAKLKPVWTRELKRAGLEPGARVDYSKLLKGTPSTSTDLDELADTKFGGDNGAPNGTSIAVLAEYGGASALLAADAHAPVLVNSIKQLLTTRGGDRLKVDVYKVSHHGSQNNVSTELIQLLDCPQYIISTNGDHFCHPDRQAIARILKYGGAKPTLHFNYRSKYNAVWEDPALRKAWTYKFEATYPAPDQAGAIVSLI